jgi:hypothetical protein
MSNQSRPVKSVVESVRTLEGGGLDERPPWRSPLRGARRASNFAPGEIVLFVVRADKTRGSSLETHCEH